LGISQIISNKLKAFMDSEFVKECASVLKAAEILCPEITRFFKLEFFFSYATPDCGMIWQEIHSVILKKPCENMVACFVAIDMSVDVTDIDNLALFIQVSEVTL